MGFGPKEEKTQLDCLAGSWGTVLALPPSNRTPRKGVQSSMAASDPIPRVRPASLALGLLLTPGHILESKDSPGSALGPGLSPVHH